jgi:hypothetical protein
LNYTYNGLETLEVLVKPTIQTPDFLRLFTLKQGVRSKAQLFLGLPLQKIIKLAQSCNPTSSGAISEIVNRTIEVAELDFNLEQCADVFDDLIFEEWQKALSIDKNDLLGTEVEALLRNIVSDGMRRDLFRIFSFGDITSGNANYNQLDGMWTRLLDGASEPNNDTTMGAGSYCVTKFDDITALTQSAGTTAEDYLQEMFENSPIILRSITSENPQDSAFFVTPNIYYNYLTTLEARSGVEGAWLLLQDGKKVLSYRGVEVNMISSWEAALQDSENPLFGDYNTLMLYTAKSNHVVGVQEPRDFGSFRIWYDLNADVTKMRFKGKLGYQYAHCDLQSIKVGLV